MNRPMAGLACATLALGLSLTLTGDAKAQSKKASAPAGEWVTLFDGKSMEGWEMVELGGRKGASKWELKDGALVGTGQASMLYSPKGHYQNFRYRAEIKINDHGNSGMYIRIPEKKATFSDGYEIQINSTHGDPIKTGSVYTMVHVYKQLVKPDTWFTQEVEAVTKNYRGKILPHIKVSVDGELLYEYIDHSNAFAGPGYFAFQQHDPGSVVQIRKVEVMELPPTTK
ncbi:MAG: DUF1080 domain-containing protein [Isosphaeraceae bacterium]